MLRQRLKEALMLSHRIYDLSVIPRDSFRTEINYMALKLAVLNFPRLVKRCLINLPTSLEEPHLSERTNLIKGIRDLYYSGEDKDNFRFLLDASHKSVHPWYIDSVAGVYYSDISQLPLCYSILRYMTLPPKGFDNWIVDNLRQIRSFNMMNRLSLVRLIRGYDAENDTISAINIANTKEDIPHHKQLSSVEKDQIFDPLGYKMNEKMLSLPEVLKQILKNCRNPVSGNGYKIKWNHLVVRGNLIYTEVKIDGSVLGCGLDLKKHSSSLRLAKMVFINPQFESWLLSPKKLPTRQMNMFLRHKERCLEQEAAQTGSDEMSEISRFF